MKIRTHLGILRTVALSGEASYLFVLNLSPPRFRPLCPVAPQLDFIVELCRMALDENPHSFGDSPHSCLVWRSQLLIRFWIWAPSVSAHLPLLPPTRFYCGTMQNGTGWNSALILGIPRTVAYSGEAQLFIRFEFEPPRFRPLALLPPTRFYCGTMQNGTGWKSALIWGFSRTVALSGEASYLFVWIWAPSVSATCPVALQTRFYCGTMQNGTGWKSALIWGIPRSVA